MRPPTSRPSPVAKAIGGRGHRVVHGQEAGEVEVGLVQLRRQEVKQAMVLLGPDQLDRPEGFSQSVLGYPGYMLLTQTQCTFCYVPVYLNA
jgi:hypothetical protein